MKTKNACFWIFLLLSGSAYAQMSQKGTVQIFNSNKSPLPVKNRSSLFFYC